MFAFDALFRIAVLVFPVFFVGCVKTYDLVPSEFPQNQRILTNDEITRMYVRSATLYNEFETSAIFDVLWFSHDVVDAYVEACGVRRGKNEKEKSKLLFEKNKEQESAIVFYLLADIRGYDNPSLLEKDSMWSTYLMTSDGKKISPTSIKEVFLESEIRSFFDLAYSRYKTAYCILFSNKDSDGNSYFGTDDIVTLAVSSIDKEHRFAWDPYKTRQDQEASKKKVRKPAVKKNEDCYWG